MWRSSSVEYGQYGERLWSELPATYVQRALTAALRRTPGRASPTTRRHRRCAWRLAFDDVLTPTHAATVSLAASLRDAEHGRLLDRTFTAAAPIADDDPATMARAMGRALDEATAAVAAAVVAELRPGAASHRTSVPQTHGAKANDCHGTVVALRTLVFPRRLTLAGWSLHCLALEALLCSLGGSRHADMPTTATFRERLDGPPLLADGAMGTALHARGFGFDRCFEELNVTQPAVVADIHRGYVEAGARLLFTNSFGANDYRLHQFGLADRVAELNAAAVSIAQRVVAAAFADVHIAGDVGPLGVRLAPYGRVREEDAKAAFRDQ